MADMQSVGVDPGKDWWTMTDVCKYLGIGRMTLLKIRKAGKIPDYYPRGRPEPGQRGGFSVRFKKSDIDEYMESQKSKVVNGTQG